MHDVAPIYKKQATALGNLLAQGGHSLIWGGSDTGLMKVVADAVQEEGGKIVGITMEKIKETARKNTDELIVTKDLSERKMLMSERADAFVLLPGGIGSLNEITEILELKKHSFHNKPVVIFNIDGFYDGLHSQLGRMKHEGFIARALEDYMYFAENTRDVVKFIEKETED